MRLGSLRFFGGAVVGLAARMVDIAESSAAKAMTAPADHSRRALAAPHRPAGGIRAPPRRIICRRGNRFAYRRLALTRRQRRDRRPSPMRRLEPQASGWPLTAEGGLAPEVSAAILREESRLKAIRNWRDETQLHLSFKTGIGQGYLSDLESGRRTGTPETIAKLAQALGVPDRVAFRNDTAAADFALMAISGVSASIGRSK